jgi:hypothetical protein
METAFSEERAALLAGDGDDVDAEQGGSERRSSGRLLSQESLFGSL